VAGDELTYYAATAAGGVWKSVNGGTKWKPIFDDQPISSIGFHLREPAKTTRCRVAGCSRRGATDRGRLAPNIAPART